MSCPSNGACLRVVTIFFDLNVWTFAGMLRAVQTIGCSGTCVCQTCLVALWLKKSVHWHEDMQICLELPHRWC